ARLGSLRRTVRLDQPRVLTTGGGALPFPTGAFPTHPLTPMARTIEQIAIRNFFMALPVCSQMFYTASKSPSGCISATYSQPGDKLGGRHFWLKMGPKGTCL